MEDAELVDQEPDHTEIRSPASLIYHQHVRPDQHSTQPPGRAPVTTKLKISSTEHVRLASRTVCGIKIHAFAKMVSS